MRVELLYFDGCPNWQLADERVREALRRTGHEDVAVDHRAVDSFKDAEEVGFTGSPTILLDGRDPFAVDGAPVGMSCRVYWTPDGTAGSPTVSQLVDAFS